MGPSRYRLLPLLALSAACAAGGGSPKAVSRTPEPGERFFSGLRQLTVSGQNAEAYFSQSGKQLIFQWQTSDSTCDQQYVLNLDGTGLRRVSNGLGRTTCGYFYDGDRRVLYSSTFEHDARCPPPPDFSQGYVWSLFEYDIYTSALDGSDLKRLTTTPGYDAEATLSPDGRRLVFTSMRDGDLDIYTMNVDGSDVRRLTTDIGYDGGPFFSRDGSMIVYRSWHPSTAQDIAEYRALLAQAKVRPSRMEIRVMNADGSTQRQVTNLGGANFAPYFHPDGKRIIFASNHKDPRSRNFDLYLVNLDGSGLQPVTTSGEFDGFPMFSPDGKLLVFASNRFGSRPGETNLFVADWVEPQEERGRQDVKASPNKSLAQSAWEWTKSLAAALVIWFFLRSLLVEAFRIPSGSMENTLLIGDFLFVNKALYGAEVPLVHKRLPAFREPARGDVVIFDSATEPGVNVVKRVIGMPGDTIRMEDNVVHINGHALDEPYVVRTNPEHDLEAAEMRAWQVRYLAGREGRTYRPTLMNWGPLLVPPDSFFVMGDNRDNSYDSRYWGFLGRDRIRGRPLFIYYSYDKNGLLPLPIFTAIRWDRLLSHPH